MRTLMVLLALTTGVSAQEPDYQNAWELLLGEHDKNGDGKIAKSEYGRGDVRFNRLDRDGDGFITQADTTGGGRGRGGGRGGGRGNETPTMTPEKRTAVMLGRLLGADEEVDRKGVDKWFLSLDGDQDGKLVQKELTCVTSWWAKTAIKRLDKDADKALSKNEIAKAYAIADTDKSGTLSKSELAAPAARQRGGRNDRRGGRNNGGKPPAVGQVAPDFTLKTLDGKAKHTLSSYKGKKPVALIFGSYT